MEFVQHYEDQEAEDWYCVHMPFARRNGAILVGMEYVNLFCLAFNRITGENK